MAGGGIISANASPYLAVFAKKINAPVVYTLMGKGAISDKDDLNLGLIGMHGTVTAAKSLIESDVIIALGTRFSDRVALNRDLFANGKKVIHVDIDNAEFDKNVKSTLHVFGDVGQFLKTVTPLVNSVENKDWLKEIASFRKEEASKKKELELGEKILESASRLAPKDIPIVTDVGQHQMWTAQHYSIDKPRLFCSSGGLGTMGYGMGAAIGASFGAGKMSILVTGDGCFNMNLNELSTAVTEGVPMVILLMNNGVLGMVRQWQKIFYGRRFSQTTLHKKTDYVKFAESFGAKGIVIDNEKVIDERLKEAFDYATKNCTPVLVDCRISCDENVLPMIKPGMTYDTQLEEMEEK
jgi:acetolactate synthase-1/2/3 large subunit